MIKLIKFLIQRIAFKLLDIFLASAKEIEPRTILLIRLDSIGDYILFRNFIEIIKTSEKYKDYRITLLGNIVWKDLSIALDSKYIDKFIWLDRNRFNKDLVYRYRKLREIISKGYEVALSPTYSREFFYADTIVKSINAKEKIGSSGDLSNIRAWQKKIADKWYTELLLANNENIFEFERNKEFFAQLLKIDINIKKPYIDVGNVSFNAILNKPYAVIFPGGGSRFRRWKIDNFAKIGDFLASKYYLNVIVAGSSTDILLAKQMKQKIKTVKIIDLTNKTSLPQLAKLVFKSSILISNETSAVHLAVAVNAKTVCISNGNHLGRFCPYPENIYNGISYIYPEVIMKEIAENNSLPKMYRYGSRLDINTIKIRDVKQLIENLMRGYSVTAS